MRNLYLAGKKNTSKQQFQVIWLKVVTEYSCLLTVTINKLVIQPIKDWTG